MKKLMSKFVEVEADFMKGTNIITGESVEKIQLIDERNIVGKIVKVDKYCNSDYKYKVRLFPGVCRWYKASEVKDMKIVK